MTAIGSIRFQALSASRLRDISLERSVATVDQQEADNGAARSDVVRLASREQEGDSKVPLSVYLKRAAKFRAELKKSKTEEQKKPECPINKARAESTTGENVPLNWLVADHFGGQTEAGPTGHDLLMSTDISKTFDAQSEFTAQPKVASEPQSLLAEEWLLSPCA